MPAFLVVPAANVNAEGEPTTLTGAILDNDTTLGGLTNGTAYRAFVLSGPSAPFTPVAAPSTSVTLQTVLSYNDVNANVHTFAAGFSANTGDTIVLGISARNASGPQGILSVTIGGQTMTLGSEAFLGVLSRHAIRQLTAPIAPTDNIVITYVASGLYPASHVRPYRCVGFAASFFNQATAVTSTNSDQQTVTVNVPAGGALFAVHSTSNPQGTIGDTTVTGATMNFDQILPVGGIRRTNIANATGLSAETGRTVTFDGVQVVSRCTSVVTLAPA